MPEIIDCPVPDTPFYRQHALTLCSSYKHWTGKDLLPEFNNHRQCILTLFEAPFVLVSHGTEQDSIFNFGNRAALTLFEMKWEDFIRLPSRKSADADNQEDRARLMASVSARGYATDCRGTRISASSKRFLITGATVWNVVNDQGAYYGQAAMFTNWSYL